MLFLHFYAWDSDEDNTGRVLLRRDFSCNLCDIDYEALYADASDQKLMELFLQQMSFREKERFQLRDGSYRSACEWHKNIQCDENDRVVKIVYKFAAEELALDLLPRCLEFFVIPCDKNVSESGLITKNFCTGPLLMSCLPSTLRIFDVYGNILEGEVGLAQMPRKVVDFNIGFNRFVGSCDLTNLSPQLTRCELFGNLFSGTISLDDLPKTLISLNLSGNVLKGNLNFARLPDSLRTLHLNENYFTGAFILDQRNSPIYLDARDNEFYGNAVVPSCDDIHVFLRTCTHRCGIVNVLDENGDVHERKVNILSNEAPKRHMMAEVDENTDIFLYPDI